MVTLEQIDELIDKLEETREKIWGLMPRLDAAEGEITDLLPYTNTVRFGESDEHSAAKIYWKNKLLELVLLCKKELDNLEPKMRSSYTGYHVSKLRGLVNRMHAILDDDYRRNAPLDPKWSRKD